jgi:hypothetical protein
MVWNARFVMTIKVVSVAVLIAALGVPLANQAAAADRGEARVVRLDCSVSTAGRPFINATPARAKLWRNDPEKFSKIEWMIDNFSPYDELYWEIRPLEEDQPGYFSDMDIPCGQTTMVVAPAEVPDTAKAQWPYRVSVYVCADGVKGDLKASAETNLRIVWKD